jgi:hypothetical protein
MIYGILVTSGHAHFLTQLEMYKTYIAWSFIITIQTPSDGLRKKSRQVSSGVVQTGLDYVGSHVK